jgi:hypothetical protein
VAPADSKKWPLSLPGCPLPAKYANSVDLKDGLFNNRVCTVKFPAIDSRFSSNTTNAEVPSFRMDLEVW